ncbi:MAG TPA: sulfatase [Verrucomicrobiales bacterium]|nr:sulfatase [Verrucomicrobiales bacterium]
MKPLCTGSLPLTGLSRRQFLNRFGMGLGGIALASLMNPPTPLLAGAPDAGVLGAPHFAPKAKRIIYLFMAGGPSQLETFDYKPVLNERNGEDLPASVRMGQRLTGMSGNQAVLPLAGSIYKFGRHGSNGTWVSELLPHTAQVVDDLAIVRSLYTEAINHDPAITFLQTGSQISGRPSIGAWVHYGLGNENDNLPAFVVLITPGKVDQPLYARLWGSGFLPAEHQGVHFRSGREPVLYLNNPEGISGTSRRRMLDTLRDLHQLNADRLGEADVDARIAQYEMAYRMQTSMPELVDIANEPKHVLEMYGTEPGKSGFATNCLLARRLVEKGVRFVQLYHWGWDSHGDHKGNDLRYGMVDICRETDRPIAALIKDLKARGMLDETLIVWGGEFGRTPMNEARNRDGWLGRDHHPHAYTMWMAGGGVKGGMVHGETDEFGYNVARDGVHVHDLHATMLHLLGVDHERLTFKYQGRHFRLTDVHGKVVKSVLA